MENKRGSRLRGEIENFYVKETGKGGSVFVNRDYKNKEKIVDFKGDFFTSKELPFPFTEKDDHYLQIGINCYLGPSGGIDDLINHSCDPNAGLLIDANKVALIAIKDIKKGEELTFDYSTTMDEDDWEMKCLCKSLNCRETVRDFKHLSKEVQERYIALGVVPSYVIKNLKNIK